MSRTKNTIWCDGCGEEITWVPLMKEGCHYCCQDCLDDLPCKCYRWSEMDLSRRDEESSTDADLDAFFHLSNDA